MANKKIATIIAAALTINHIPNITVLENTIGDSQRIDNVQVKKNNSYDISGGVQDNIIFINDRLSNNAIVNNENEFITLISNPNIRYIKLNSNIDLTTFKDADVLIKAQEMIIDGQGNNIIVPSKDIDYDEKFLWLKGNNIVFKNINLIIKDEIKNFKNLDPYVLSIDGDNILLENVKIEGVSSKGINLKGSNIKLNNINITGKEKKSTGIFIDNGKVTLNNVKIDIPKGIGIEIVGKDSTVNMGNNLVFNTGIDVKTQYRDGTKINYNKDQLTKIHEFFGYRYYNLINN